MLLKEFCAENFTLIPQALAAGARRIELCDNLAVGGTTVSTGVLEETLFYCSEKKVPVMTMIRPRGGNFVYNDTELKIMETDLWEAKKLGVDGIVIGCLTPEKQIDKESLKHFIELADGMQITFHMAFDQLSMEDQFHAIDYLSDQGVHRILTHGGNLDQPIEEHLIHLESLIRYASGRITILPGGGITTNNLESIVNHLQINEVHGTKVVNLSMPTT